MSAAQVVFTALAGVLTLLVASWIRNAYFHPLSKFPGPKNWAASRLPFVSALVSGQLPHRVRALHGQYGPVVRVAPDELSFIDPAAWKDIYTNNEYIRPWIWRGKPPGAAAESLITANEVDHARFRKLLGPGFSEKAIRLQELIINSYIDLLIEKLKAKVRSADQKGAVLDVVEWLNYTTFDIIGDLSWNSSFECLNSQKLSGWIQVVLHFKAVVIAVSFKYFPPLDSIIDAITPKAALAPILGVVETAKQKVAQRFEMETDRPDMINYIDKYAEKSSSEMSMTRGEIEMNSFAVIVAGSESLTTILTGIIHKLMSETRIRQKLVDEIRTAFRSEADIDGISAAKLPYLNAVLNEGMRVVPSIPDGSRRVIPTGAAADVAGHYVPGGTTVSVPQWSAYMASSNFVDATAFVPERWLSSEPFLSTYKNDRKDIFRPFGVGTHNCLGQPLAWHEMRVILARLLWTFDIEQPDGVYSFLWESQPIYWTWDKQPVKVKLELREHS